MRRKSTTTTHNRTLPMALPATALTDEEIQRREYYGLPVPGRRYTAVMRDCGVTVATCGHRHRTENAAKACGDELWTYTDEDGQLHVASHWFNGGVEVV